MDAERELLYEALGVADAHLREAWSPAARAAALIARRKKHGGMWGRNLARALGGGKTTSPSTAQVSQALLNHLNDTHSFVSTRAELGVLRRAAKRGSATDGDHLFVQSAGAAPRLMRNGFLDDRGRITAKGRKELAGAERAVSTAQSAGVVARRVKYKGIPKAEAKPAKKGRPVSPRPAPTKEPTVAARAKKLGITMRQEGGDDGYQYVVRHGSKEITGLTKREAIYHRQQFVLAAEKKTRGPSRIVVH